MSTSTASSVATITSCEVCGNQDLSPVLNLGKHPLCDDLVALGDARVCAEYPIEVLYCPTCRTAHQKYQIPKRELFPRSYHYRARFTADVLNGMKDLVLRTEEVFGSLAQKRVLDIGCNDGSLLDFFREKGATTIGVEPTGAATDAAAKGHAVYDDFFTVDLAKKILAEHGAPDIITFTNVFAHIEHLGGVIDALNLLSHAGTAIVIENHYLGGVLSGYQFDTFYHEHPRTYSYRSFTIIAKSLKRNLVNVEFPSRYGGNIRVFIGDKPVQEYGAPAIDEREAKFAGQFATLAAGVEKWKTNKRAQLSSYSAKHGPLRAKAFPARAAILVKLLGLDEKIISSVHERPGSMKIGHYVPGTRIPIASDDELLASDRKAPLINFAWHISKEIQGYLRKSGYEGEIIDVLSADDF
jgi:SAM-dependent methyltransferase